VAFHKDTNPAAARQIAADIDLRCALAFGRAALQAVSTLSPTARGAAVAALEEEAVSAIMDGGPEAAAVAAILDEVSQRLHAV
jgi:hypothetical protein